MKLISKPISLKRLKQLAEERFGNLIKVVVDIDKEIMALDAELHADEEALLLEDGSNQEDLWGINLYPEFHGSKDFIEFDSMINLKPSQANPDRGVCDPEIRKKIVKIVNKLIKK